jgi:hypothetical protein
MIEILKDGTIIISLGIGGILFLFYIILEIFFIKIKGFLFLHSIIVYLIFLQRFKKTIPVGWTLKQKLFDFGFIKKQGKIYSVIQHIDCEMVDKRIYTFIYIDWMGRIVKNDVVEVCREHEETMDPGKIKSFRREKSLKDLGI